MKDYYVYMMTNKSNRVLYTRVTNGLRRRIMEHKSGVLEGFTKKYNLTKLVYYEHGSGVEGAIMREKQIKGWLRKKKNALIETVNPEWQDLAENLEV